MRRRPLLTTAAVAASLALPSAALAQSAGDDQYTDPFSGQDAPAQGDGNDSGGDSQESPGTAPPPSGGDAGTAPAQETPPPATGGNGTASAETLPSTGPPVAAQLLAGAGSALLLGGFAIRRRT